MLASFQPFTIHLSRFIKAYQELTRQLEDTTGQLTEAQEQFMDISFRLEGLDQKSTALEGEIEKKQLEHINEIAQWRAGFYTWRHRIKMLKYDYRRTKIELYEVKATYTQEKAEYSQITQQMQGLIEQSGNLRKEMDTKRKLVKQRIKERDMLQAWKEASVEERNNQSKNIEEKNSLLEKCQEYAQLVEDHKNERDELKNLATNLNKQKEKRLQELKKQQQGLEQKIIDLVTQNEMQKKERERKGTLWDLGLRMKSLLAFIFQEDQFLELMNEDVVSILAKEENKSKLIALNIVSESDYENLLKALSNFLEKRVSGIHPALKKNRWDPEYLKGLGKDTEEQKQIQLCIRIFQNGLNVGEAFGNRRDWELKFAVKN